MRAFPWFLSGFLLLTLLLMGRSGCSEGGGNETFTDTVTVYDTVTVTQPVLVDSTVIRYRTVLLKVSDTSRVTVYDSVSVEIPIESKKYEGKSYTAYVSGYDPRLDSITVYPEIRTVTKTEIRRDKFGIGVTAGAGVGREGLTPFIGVGVTYNIFTW